MSTYSKPRILAFLADVTTIVEGCVVKVGSDRSHVTLAAASTDKILGLSQTSISNTAEGVTGAVGDPVEVALSGAGAKGLCGSGGSIAAGDYLTSDANGALVTTTSAGDRVVAMAMEAAVSGDLFSVEVVNFIHN